MAGSTFGKVIAISALLVTLGPGVSLRAQGAPYAPPESSFQQPQPLLSPGQLANLVAPVALYPDPLLSQILVVSTYPSELADAAQWLEHNPGLSGREALYAARQQNWDPSIQALVAFPNVMALLSSNLQWTSALGQAFLAQPADVMNAIQALRAEARDRGQLVATPQFSINTQSQDGQSAVEIVPADPQMMYVPAYNPYSVWGPPAEGGSYPDLSYQGSTFGSLISSAINLAGMFAGFNGLLSPGSWGWALSWLAHTLFVNNSFVSALGSGNSGGGYGGDTGSSVWVHNAGGGTGSLYASNAGGWRPFGSSGSYLGGPGRSAFGPRPAAFGPNFREGARSASEGTWRQFNGNDRRPAFGTGNSLARSSWNGQRSFQSPNRFAGAGFLSPGGRERASLANWRHGTPGYGGFSNFQNGHRAQAPRWASEPSGRSWRHPFRSSRSRMASGYNFDRGRSPSSRHFPKPPRAPRMPHYSSSHFKSHGSPHFSAPHFKSHGSPHFSHGHSGGKSHRR